MFMTRPGHSGLSLMTIPRQIRTQQLSIRSLYRPRDTNKKAINELTLGHLLGIGGINFPIEHISQHLDNISMPFFLVEFHG